MCLTLANAADVSEHQDTPSPQRGYTRTHHHACYLEPGDQWRPDGDRVTTGRPHTVMAISRGQGLIVLTDQYGMTFKYAVDDIVPTVVVDGWSGQRVRQWR